MSVLQYMFAVVKLDLRCAKRTSVRGQKVLQGIGPDVILDHLPSATHVHAIELGLSVFV